MGKERGRAPSQAVKPRGQANKMKGSKPVKDVSDESSDEPVVSRRSSPRGRKSPIATTTVVAAVTVAPGKKKRPTTASSTTSNSSSSGGGGSRARPPSSFYCMDFLDEEDEEDMMEEGDLEDLAEVDRDGEDYTDNLGSSQKNKIKTETELEEEYKHILYGVRKRRGAKLGLSKKKKQKKTRSSTPPVVANKPVASPSKAAASVNKHVTSPSKAAASVNKPATSPSKPVASPGKGKKGKKSVVASIKTEDKKPVTTLPVILESPRTRSGVKTETESSPPSSSVPPPTSTSMSWKGKKASKRSLDSREIMREKAKKPYTSSKIEDVTGKYGKEEELVSCGICDMIDPPLEDQPLEEEEVEWVGCDCYRWFHKPCTKLMKFTEKFSCRSVKMKCLEAPPVPVKPVPAEPVIKKARVRFQADYPRLMIRNIR